MISSRAIKQFLARPLDDLYALKKASVAWIDEQLKKVEFKTAPRFSQKVGVTACLRCPGLVLLYDMGTGKTKIALDALRFWLGGGGKGRRALVLVQNVVSVESWLMEADKHASDLDVAAVGTGWDVRQDDVCVATYAALLRATTSSVTSKKGKSAWAIDKSKLQKVLGQFECVVFDESTALKSWQSLTFKVCRSFLRTTCFRLCMTGTPMGRDVQDLWAQFYVADGGEALGQTLGMFREAFFTTSKNYWGGYDYRFRPKQMSALHRMMAHSSLRYSIEECTDLPDRLYCERPISFGDEQHQYYLAALERAREASTAQEKGGGYMAMRMLASGFAHVDDRYIDFEPNLKLDVLRGLMDEIGSVEKVVVFNTFVHSGELISRMLKEMGVGHSRIYSGTRDKPGELRRFLSDPACRVLVGNSSSTAMALNLQIARYVIFYEAPNSPIVRDQAERRVWRPGQERTVIYYDLYVKGSIEQKLLQYLKSGRDLFEAIVNGQEGFV